MNNTLTAQKFVKANLIALIFNALFNLPIAFYKPFFFNNISGIDIIIEIFTIFVLNNLLFYLVLQLKYLSNIIITFLFILGGICTYYLIHYQKLFDIGVTIDVLSVEKHLVKSYIDSRLIIVVCISAILGAFLSQSKFLEKPIILKKFFVIINILLTVICIISFLKSYNNPKKIKFIIKDYLPYVLPINVHQFFRDYLPRLKETKNKVNIPQKFPPKLDIIPKEPLLIVLIIGESMRGDLISLNGYQVDNMPLLTKVPNLISFTNATSSSTCTRISLPYMLTTAIPPNFDQALSERSIISMFKALGFKTSWIGSQGAFNEICETTYASIALEADYVLFQPQICQIIKEKKIYDGDLLNIITSRLNEVKENHFMVIHLLGSHWHFDERYPPEFEKFAPACKSKKRRDCSRDMILNGYYNTCFYTDFVVNQIINSLKAHNSFLLYSSDHGFSLEEEGFFGNAYTGDNVPNGQVNIGMFVWASDEFIKDNQANYQKILNKRMQPISHNYIYHSLLGCTNVSSEIIDQQYNLCH